MTRLVWNHPHISPQKMKELTFWANDELFTTQNSMRTAAKVLYQSLQMWRKQGLGKFSVPVWAGNIETLGVPLRKLARYGSRSMVDENNR